MLLASAVLAAAAVTSPADLGPVPAEQVRIFLIRHGQAYSNLDPTPDLPPAQLDRLTELGHSQARRAGRALKGRGVTLVLSSPASRARESAEALAAALGAGIARVDPRLRPLELGRSAAGEPLDWDAREAEWAAGHDPEPAAGESLDQVGRRVQELVTSLAKEHRGAGVVLVAHSEVIGAFLGLVAGTPAPHRLDASSVRNGSITVVEAGDAEPARLVLLDYVPSETSERDSLTRASEGFQGARRSGRAHRQRAEHEPNSLRRVRGGSQGGATQRPPTQDVASPPRR